jgi:integrase
MQTRTLSGFQSVQLHARFRTLTVSEAAARLTWMASVQRVKSPFTGRISYRVQVRVKGWPAQSATFRNRRRALAWGASRDAAIREERYFPQARALRTTFAELAQRYRDMPEADTGPNATTRARHIRWWEARFGVLALAAIGPDRIAEARDALARETFKRAKARDLRGLDPPRAYVRSGATVNRYLATLSHMFSLAVKEWRLIDRNPAYDVGKKKESRGRVRFLDDTERATLLAACERSPWPALHALVLLAISTGARRGELLALKWADLELDGPAPRAIVPTSKNGDARVLPLVGKALQALRALRTQARPGSQCVFPAPGTDLPYRYFDAHWYRALEVAGIGDFRFHDLRHTCASYLASQGASLLEIADVLGHRTMAMVKRYSHLTKGHKVRLLRRMAEERGI